MIGYFCEILIARVDRVKRSMQLASP